MEVTVTLDCGRCGKKETKQVQLTEAQELLAQNEAKAGILTDLETELNDVLKPEHPELIIARKVDGQYTIKMLDNMCHTPDAKRNKGCQTRVETLIGDIFMTNEAPPRKKKAEVIEEEAAEE